MAKRKRKDAGKEGAGPETQPTGVEDLDDILHGGVPQGSSVLISGASGTGKTSICFEILCRAAAEDEPGVILLTSETPERALDNLSTFDYFDHDLVDDGKLVVKDMHEMFQDLGIAHPDTGLSQEDGHKLLEAIDEEVDSAKAKRLAIDSLTEVLSAFESEGRVRDFLRALVRTMASKGVTTYLTSEISPDVVRYSSMGIEDTLADGVVLLSNLESRGDLLRSLQVIKMRGIQHSRSRYVMDLTRYGTIIVPVLKSYSKGGGGE